MNRQLALAFLLVLAACLLFSGCRSQLPARFSRYSIGLPVRGPQVTVTIVADHGWLPGETATMTVTWTDSTAPYTIAADLGGGTTENIPAGTPAASPFKHVFTLVDLGTYAYAVVITDANGNEAAASGTYNVDGSQYLPGDDNDDGGGGNQNDDDPDDDNPIEDPGNPLGVAAVYNRLEKMLSISTSHRDELAITVQISDLPKWVMVPGGPTHIVEGGNGTLLLGLSLLKHDENACELYVSASDEEGNTDGEPVGVIRPLFISSAYYDPGSGCIEVNVDAQSVQTVTVRLSVPDDVFLDCEPERAQDGGGEYLFPVTWNELTFNGGTVAVQVYDQYENQDADDVPLYLIPDSYEPDTLYAFPILRSVAVGEQARIIVASGMPAGGFQYMNGVGVTVDGGASFADDTFNIGAPGGDKDYPDGIWSHMEPAPDAFLLPVDFMIQENDIGEGRVRIDFNVTPIGGSNVSDGGEIFNFCLEFDHAGQYILGFEEFRDVKRTYYSAWDSSEYYWGDISNDYPNALNAIIVTE